MDKVKLYLPELNANQRKWLLRTLLSITNQARNKDLPIHFIEHQIKELLDDTLGIS